MAAILELLQIVTLASEREKTVSQCEYQPNTLESACLMSVDVPCYQQYPCMPLLAENEDSMTTDDERVLVLEDSRLYYGNHNDIVYRIKVNITNLSIPAYWHYSMCMVKTCLLISQQVLYTLMRSQCVQIFLKLKLTENNHVKTYMRQLVCIIATIQPGSIYNYNTFEVATKELLQQQGHFNINA